MRNSPNTPLRQKVDHAKAAEVAKSAESRG